jgi:hypothetical protein
MPAGRRIQRRIFPGRLEALDAWVPPWRAQPELEAVSSAPDPAGMALAHRYQDTAVALEALLKTYESDRHVTGR